MGRVDSVKLVGTTLLSDSVVTVSWLVVAILVKSQDTVRVNSVCPPSAGGGPWSAGSASCLRLALRVRLGDSVERSLLLAAAGASAAVITAACLLVSLDSWLQVGALAGLLAAVALDMSRARLTHCTAVCALRNGSALLVDVLQRTVRVLTVAHAVAANAGLASVLLSIN